MANNDLTKWHHAYIQNAYRELRQGTTRKQLDALNIKGTGKNVLDVGCGPGNHLVVLSKQSPKLLVGVDIDQRFLTIGRSRIAELIRPSSTRPLLIRASLPTLPFANNTFDLVTCFLVMPHVSDDEEALSELARVLKPGGTLAISGHGLGFPIRYLKRLRIKPLQMYLASFIYRLSGKKLIRNTLQNDKKMCQILKSIGLTVDILQHNKKVFGFVSTYWIGATKMDTKSEMSPNATQ